MILPTYHMQVGPGRFRIVFVSALRYWFELECINVSVQSLFVFIMLSLRSLWSAFTM